jgi:hypothetical protein
VHRSATSGPDPRTGADDNGRAEDGSASDLQRRAQQPRDPGRPEPDWRDPRQRRPQPRDPGGADPDWREPQARDPQRPAVQRPAPSRRDAESYPPLPRDPQQTVPQRGDAQPRAPRQGDLQERRPRQTGPQGPETDWRDPQQRGPQLGAAQQRDQPRPGAQGRVPQRPSAQPTGPQRGEPDWRGPQQRDGQRPGTKWRGPSQGDPRQGDAQQDGPPRRGAPRRTARRPVADWRDRNQRSVRQGSTRQRDREWGDADWDGPQRGGPESGGPRGYGPDGGLGGYGSGSYSPTGGGPRGYGPSGGGPGWGGPDAGGPVPGGPGRHSPMRRGPWRGPRRRGRKRTPLHRRRWAQITAAVLAAFLIIVSWSVGHALTAPGGGSLSTRLAEWARDHDLGPLVTFGEWLTYQPPKVGGKPSFNLSGEGLAAAKQKALKLKGRRAALAALYAPPLPLKTFARTPLPGEGQWRVLATVGGRPAIFGTYLRASSVYTSYVAGIAELNQKLVRFQLRPGVEDPGGSNWKAQPYIPPGTRNGLLATFNSGFKINASDGGFYLNGQTAGTLTRGVASEVYYRDGHMTIGVWGQTVRMTPDVVGVRQNLHLIVINGRVPTTVDNNVESSWGATLGGGYYVWRSGIGETKNGRIVFAYGPALNVREIADLLQRAGAVIGMQLDINPEWMSFMYYEPKHHPNDPTPFNLLPTQQEPADRYYSINSRDFTAVYAR